jgi:epidermal growth factor receptor substrate 15
MADLNLTPDEKRVFQHLFQQADTEKLGVITGEIAVKFFERTKLAPAVLEEVLEHALLIRRQVEIRHGCRAWVL